MVVALAMWLFRQELRNVLQGIRIATLPGAEVERNETLATLERSAEVAANEVESAPTPELRPPREESAESEILGTAGESPSAALLSLSAALERELRELLESVGHLPRSVTLRRLAEEASRVAGLPKATHDALALFSDVRYELVHRGSVAHADVLRALDSGITILRVVQSLPRDLHTVHAPAMQLFSDEWGRRPIADVRGVSLLEGDYGAGPRVFPTRRMYTRGEVVSWEWDVRRMWGPTWYRDSETGEIEMAWTQSAEFTGRPLAEVPE
jgi:hypothetical protein